MLLFCPKISTVKGAVLAEGKRYTAIVFVPFVSAHWKKVWRRVVTVPILRTVRWLGRLSQIIPLRGKIWTGSRHRLLKFIKKHGGYIFREFAYKVLMPFFLTETTKNCLLLLVEILLWSCYHDVKNNGKGGTSMRKTYIDNIRWMTIVIVAF